MNYHEIAPWGKLARTECHHQTPAQFGEERNLDAWLGWLRLPNGALGPRLYLRNTARNCAHRMRRCSCVTTENIKNKIDKTNAAHCNGKWKELKRAIMQRWILVRQPCNPYSSPNHVPVFTAGGSEPTPVASEPRRLKQGQIKIFVFLPNNMYIEYQIWRTKLCLAFCTSVGFNCFSGIYVEWIEISQLILMAEASALLNLRQVCLDRTHSTLIFLSVRGKTYELTDRTAAAHLVVNHLPTTHFFLWTCSQWIFP